MNKLICQKPAHFLSAQMTFFQMFIVLGMYNFESFTKATLKLDFLEVILRLTLVTHMGRKC